MPAYRQTFTSPPVFLVFNKVRVPDLTCVVKVWLHELYWVSVASGYLG